MTTQSTKFIIAVALSAALATPALAQGMCGQRMTGGQGMMHGGQGMMHGGQGMMGGQGMHGGMGGQGQPGGQGMMHGGQGMTGGQGMMHGGQGMMHGGQAMMMDGQGIRGGQAMMHGGQGMMGGSTDGRLDRIEGRLAFLRTELKITDAQMPQWNKLTEAVRASGKNMNERMQARMAEQEQAATLPERLERREQLMTARLEEVKQVKGALNELYSSLTEEQKNEANTLVLPMIGMDGMGMSPGR